MTINKGICVFCDISEDMGSFFSQLNVRTTQKAIFVSVSGKQAPDGGGERLRVGSDTA